MRCRVITRSHFISGPSVQCGAGRALQDRQADGEALQTGEEDSSFTVQFVRHKKGRRPIQRKRML